MWKLWTWVVLAVASAGACGGGNVAPDAGVPAPDAATDAAPPPPDANLAACHEFVTPAYTTDSLPLTYSGSLAGAGADVEAPTECDHVDAPFGQGSAGPDTVLEITGLTPASSYTVRLASDDDLAFYVVTGCSTPTGPSDAECLLFEDAQTTAAEVGTFTAPADGTAYVVIDYYAAGTPQHPNFTLQLYADECDTSTVCGGRTPVCQDHRCVGCSNDFECTDPDAPVCDQPTFTCVAGPSSCIGDDSGEDNDDGPAGARRLDDGAAIDAAICDNPRDEHDFYEIVVDTPGEDWTITLAWSAQVDLDLYVYDATGRTMGASLYEQPERVALTYLPVGHYYAMVDAYTQNGSSLATPYTISASRNTDTCQSAADCAADFRNQIFRGDCVGGACTFIDGDGVEPAGARCDSASDCDPGTSCSSFFFVADADTRMVCGSDCDGDDDCAAMGSSYVCTNYLATNICVQKCTSDDQCPTDPDVSPTSGPWERYSCQTSTGKCVPP